MTASKLHLKHVDQLIFGFTLPDNNCKSHGFNRTIQGLTPNPKMKVASLVLRWTVPHPMSPVQENDAEGSTVVDMSESRPLISPCFSAGKDTCPSNWRIHVLTNHCENEEKYLSVFLEFYEYLEKDLFPPTKMNAIYIVRLLDASGNILISRRSGIRYFNSERLCYGWKPFVSLKSVENLLNSGGLRIEVDLTILRCQKLHELITVQNSEVATTPIITFPPEDEDKLSEHMESLCLKPGEIDEKAEKDIEWTSITCNNVTLPKGNKKLLMEKSGFFKRSWDKLWSQRSESALKISNVENPEIMAEVINFLNGNLQACPSLSSNDYEKLEQLFIRSRSFDIPSLRIACFNAMAGIGVNKVTCDQALSLAFRARSHNLCQLEECQEAMTLVRKSLMRYINILKHSQVMKENQEHASWIAECLLEAD